MSDHLHQRLIGKIRNRFKKELSYLPLRDLVKLIDDPARAACERFVEGNFERLEKAYGSVHNHQSWPGGYWDHVTEIMNIVRRLYVTMSSARPLPFSLSDALLVCFLHDIEKPWKYEDRPGGGIQEKPAIRDKEAQHAFRAGICTQYGIVLTDDQWRALHYVEGELNDYSARERKMNPLGALCHMADVASARIWFDHPAVADDSWVGAKRGAR